MILPVLTLLYATAICIDNIIGIIVLAQGVHVKRQISLGARKCIYSCDCVALGGVMCSVFRGGDVVEDM